MGERQGVGSVLITRRRAIRSLMEQGIGCPQVRRGTAGGEPERLHRNDASVRSRNYVV